MDLFLEKERIAAIQAEAAKAERERREKEKARKAAEKKASIELKEKINKAKESLSEPDKAGWYARTPRGRRRRIDEPFNPFSATAVEERNRRLRERTRPRSMSPVEPLVRSSLEDLRKKAQEKLAKTDKTTKRKTKPELTKDEIDAVRKKGRDKYHATKQQKPSVIKKTNSAKPSKSSPEIDELKGDISQLEAMINIEQKKIDSKNSTKKVISDARSLKSRYAKRLREKKAKIDKLLKELDENND